jgi:hypothetical protein
VNASLWQTTDTVNARVAKATTVTIASVLRPFFMTSLLCECP